MVVKNKTEAVLDEIKQRGIAFDDLSVIEKARMGAIEMGLAEEELQPLVDSWRAANSNIVKFWWSVDRAVKTAVKQKKQTDVNGIRFFCQSGMV